MLHDVTICLLKKSLRFFFLTPSSLRRNTNTTLCLTFSVLSKREQSGILALQQANRVGKKNPGVRTNVFVILLEVNMASIKTSKETIY